MLGLLIGQSILTLGNIIMTSYAASNRMPDSQEVNKYMVLFDSHLTESLRSRENFRVVWFSIQWHHQRIDFFLPLALPFVESALPYDRLSWMVIQFWASYCAPQKRESEKEKVDKRVSFQHPANLLTRFWSLVCLELWPENGLRWINLSPIHLSHLWQEGRSASLEHMVIGEDVDTLMEIGCWGGTILSTTETQWLF